MATPTPNARETYLDVLRQPLGAPSPDEVRLKAQADKLRALLADDAKASEAFAYKLNQVTQSAQATRTLATIGDATAAEVRQAEEDLATWTQRSEDHEQISEGNAVQLASVTAALAAATEAREQAVAERVAAAQRAAAEAMVAAFTQAAKLTAEVYGFGELARKAGMTRHARFLPERVLNPALRFDRYEFGAYCRDVLEGYGFDLPTIPKVTTAAGTYSAMLADEHRP
jgi:hypothetical protein